MAYTTIMAYEPLRSFNAASLSGTYQPLGGPLTHAGTIVKMVNDSTVSVTVSFDGGTDQDVCPASSFWLYDETANSPGGSSSATFLPKGTQVSVKGIAGTGTVYLVVQYIVQV